MLESEDFLRPDRPIVSGAMHYFRTLPRQWPHRLRMLRAMGATSVETYVPWNLHERRRGEFDFTGIADLEGFLRDAADAGLAAIVRPGPYICAEWENGGLPAWLRADHPAAPLRCGDPAYLAAVDAWFDVLVPKLAAHQVDRGGNVFAVQLENEYGSYGTDTDYLNHLADNLRRNGITVQLFTSDGPRPHQLTGGTVPGVPATVNFGSGPADAFAVLDAHRPGETKWCMEFWNGWFDHWGESHHVRDAAEAAGVLDEMLGSGAKVNIYMAHGGTNFGTWSGANHEDGYQPTITSYDYDAPISEAGGATPKYHAFREVIGKYLPTDLEIPDPEPVLKPTTVELTETLPLHAVLAGLPETGHVFPPRFEDLGIDNGLVWYRHQLRAPRELATLHLPGLGDRAHVFLGETLIGVVEPGDDGPEFGLSTSDQGLELGILVESLGRVNFGPKIGQSKGLVGGVRHGDQHLHGWTSRVLGLDDITGLPWGTDTPAIDKAPVYRRGRFTVSEPGNGFVALPGFTKGYVWVNGFCLGRFWDRGPQRTMYLPWPLLHAGDNEIVVADLHPGDATRVEIHDTPDLG